MNKPHIVSIRAQIFLKVQRMILDNLKRKYANAIQEEDKVKPTYCWVFQSKLVCIYVTYQHSSREVGCLLSVGVHLIEEMKSKRVCPMGTGRNNGAVLRRLQIILSQTVKSFIRFQYAK